MEKSSPHKSTYSRAHKPICVNSERPRDTTIFSFLFHRCNQPHHRRHSIHINTCTTTTTIFVHSNHRIALHWFLFYIVYSYLSARAYKYEYIYTHNMNNKEPSTYTVSSIRKHLSKHILKNGQTIKSFDAYRMCSKQRTRQMIVSTWWQWSKCIRIDGYS